MVSSFTRFISSLCAVLLLVQHTIANPIADALPWANANPQAAAAAEAYANAYAEAVAIGHPDPEAYAFAASEDDCATIGCHASCGLLIIEGQKCSNDNSYSGPYNTTCLCDSGSKFLSYYPACMNCGWTLWKYYGGYVSSALQACGTLSTEPTGTLRCSTTLSESYTIDTNIEGCSYLGNCATTTSTTGSSSVTTSSSSSSSSSTSSSSTSSSSSSSSTSSTSSSSSSSTKKASLTATTYTATTHSVTTDLAYTYSYSSGGSKTDCFTTSYNFPVATGNPIDVDFISWSERNNESSHNFYFFLNFTQDQTDVTDIQLITGSSLASANIEPVSEVWINLKQGIYGYYTASQSNTPALNGAILVTYQGTRYIYSYSCLTNRLTISRLKLTSPEDYDYCVSIGYWGYYEEDLCTHRNGTYSTVVEFRPAATAILTSSEESSISSFESSSIASATSSELSSSISEEVSASSYSSIASETSAVESSAAESSSVESPYTASSSIDSSYVVSSSVVFSSIETSSVEFTSSDTSLISTSSAEPSVESSSFVESSIEASPSIEASSSVESFSSIELSSSSVEASSSTNPSSSVESSSSTSSTSTPVFDGEFVGGRPRWTLRVPGSFGPWNGLSVEFTKEGDFDYSQSEVLINNEASTGASINVSVDSITVTFDATIDADDELVVTVDGDIVSGSSFTSFAHLVISTPDGRKLIKRAEQSFDLNSTITLDASSSSSESFPASSDITGSSYSDLISTSTASQGAASTTVITITSCESDVCSETAVTTGVTVVTTTISGAVTEYTTYCPISSTDGSAAVTSSTGTTSTVTDNNVGTTIVTVTSCDENKCSTSAVTTGVTVVTTTEGGVATTYTTYCPLSSSGVATETVGESNETITSKITVTSTYTSSSADVTTTGVTTYEETVTVTLSASTEEGTTVAPVGGSSTAPSSDSTGSVSTSTEAAVSTFEGAASKFAIGSTFAAILFSLLFI